MNQEQVIKKLLELDNNVEDFSLIFSGKKSKKVDGLYKPETREIIIHNKNFNDDNALIYTAIHEFAHHIQFTRSSGSVSAKAHTTKFWHIFHNLLFIAERKGIYLNIFKKEKRFLDLTKKFKEQFLTANGRLMKEFGRLLMEAYELCRQFEVSFEDYTDRELQLHRSIAKTLIKFNSYDINPDIGYDNMKIVARLSEPETRELALAAFSEGKSPDMVKDAISNYQTNSPDFSPDTVQKDDFLGDLLQKKERLERNIEKMNEELARINERIKELQS